MERNFFVTFLSLYLSLVALTQVGVTVCILCCPRVAFCFRLTVAVQLPSSCRTDNYKENFCKTVFQRIEANIEEHQSKDHDGFRPCTNVADAFAVLGSVCSKSLEWNFPVWFASLDLKKAFDRIEYSSLFGALQSQGVYRPYLKLLAALYCNQTGDVNGKTFPIQRGVKQGDVISPLLFNAGLEHAMRKWKLRLQHCGFDLGNGEILTNVRYADDLMLYAKHCDELVFMMEL